MAVCPLGERDQGMEWSSALLVGRECLIFIGLICIPGCKRNQRNLFKEWVELWWYGYGWMGWMVKCSMHMHITNRETDKLLHDSVGGGFIAVSPIVQLFSFFFFLFQSNLWWSQIFRILSTTALVTWCNCICCVLSVLTMFSYDADECEVFLVIWWRFMSFLCCPPTYLLCSAPSPLNFTKLQKNDVTNQSKAWNGIKHVIRNYSYSIIIIIIIIITCLVGVCYTLEYMCLSYSTS